LRVGDKHRALVVTGRRLLRRHVVGGSDRREKFKSPSERRKPRLDAGNGVREIPRQFS
jgi:hypothetical protein